MSTQDVNIAWFARNVEYDFFDFFYHFQTPCIIQKVKNTYFGLQFFRVGDVVSKTGLENIKYGKYESVINSSTSHAYLTIFFFSRNQNLYNLSLLLYHRYYLSRVPLRISIFCLDRMVSKARWWQASYSLLNSSNSFVVHLDTTSSLHLTPITKKIQNITNWSIL